MKNNHEKVVLFLPAYFAERTLSNVYHKIPKDNVDDILLVDDASQDQIKQVADKLGIKFYQNKENLGYGGNLKVCIQKSLDLGADILIELHPDDQYDPAAIPQAIQKLNEGYDFVIGSRFIKPGAALTHSMPFWKYVINRFSTFPARLILGTQLTDFHSGFRVYRRHLLERINFRDNDNDYLFSFQIIAQACYKGFKIGEVPVICRYFQGVTQINFKKSMKYGIGALETLWIFALAKLGKKHRLFSPPIQVPETTLVSH